MFEIDYRIVLNEYDDFIGQHGFFQIKCNDYIYGEMYPKEIETVMDKGSLYDWFERLAKVINYLMTTEYVALSDVESFNTWIVFQKRNDKVIISILKEKKESGSQDIEFFLKNPESGEWVNQVVSFEQLRQEVIEKGRAYIKNILINNKENELVIEMQKKFEEMLKLSKI